MRGMYSMCVCTDVQLYVVLGTGVHCALRGTVPDMPNIQHILTINGHRFDHQSGLDRAQDEIQQPFYMDLRSASIRCFQKYVKHYISTNTYTQHRHCKNKLMCKTEKPAVSLKRREWGLGILIHIEMTLTLLDMPFIARILLSIPFRY